MKRPLAVLAVVVALAATAGLVWRWQTRWPRGEIIRVLPIDADRALFLYFDGVRDGIDDEDDMGLALRRRDGDVEWAGAVSQADLQAILTVFPQFDTVTVQTVQLDQPVHVEAFALDTGERLWSWVNPSPQRGAADGRVDDWRPTWFPLSRKASAQRERVEIVLAREQAVVLDLADGSERWRAVVPGALAAEFYFDPDRVVTVGERGPVVIDLEAGSVRALGEVWRASCAIDDRVFHLEPGQPGPHVVATRVEDPAQELGRVGLPTEVAGILETCGRREGRYVLQLSDRDRGTHLVQLDQETLEVTAATSIERGAFNTIVFNHRYPRSEPLLGDLLRFVPLILDDESDTMAHTLVMVDLDRADVVWESPPRSELLHYHLARAGTHHYLIGHGQLALLSGDTGELVRAIRTEPRVEIEPPQLTADGALWLTSSDGAIVLDALTFEVIGQFGEPIAIVDATQEVTELLGR